MQFRLINDSPQTTYVLVLEIGADPDGEMVLIVSAGSGRAWPASSCHDPARRQPWAGALVKSASLPFRRGHSQTSFRNVCQRFSRRRRTSPPSLG